MRKIFLNLLSISLITFIVKSFLDVILQWILVKVGVREHIWGKFTRSLYYILIDFVLHFWAYFLVCILVYFILSSLKKLKSWMLFIFSFLIVTLVCLDNHRFQFPMKQYYFPSKQVFNYILVEEINIYTISLFLMIYLLKKLVSKSEHIEFKFSR